MVALRTWTAKLTRLEQDLRRRLPPEDTPLIRRLRADPTLIMRLAGKTPDPWQARALRSRSRRLCFLCSRQVGKSEVAAALALREALLAPPALVLLLSHTLRQSGLLFRDKVLPLWRALGSPHKSTRPTRLELELANGSRIVSLPENEQGIRGFSSARMLIIDEAAQVADGLYAAVRPMLAVSRGTLVALSTPFGQRGWFHEVWTKGVGWERYRVTAPECPRIDPAFLAEEQLALGARWYAQEYLCSFEAAVGAVFDPAVVGRALTDEVVPLFGG
jgi:hypothetical protein